MRDFFINALEKIIATGVILGAIVVVVAAFGMAISSEGGILAGILVLIGGGIYLLLIGGFAFLGLGIYQNTLRTAEAVELLARR